MLGIGTDIVRTARFAEILKKNPHRLKRLADRILHPLERDDLHLENAGPRLASAWAAKEALYKALGPEQKHCQFNTWRKTVVNGRYELLSDETRTDKVLLSLSHDGDYTIAFVARTH